MEELCALVGELVEAKVGLREVIAARDGQIAVLEAWIVELERRLGADSLTSSRPPLSDLPYRKPVRRLSRNSLGRRLGKQPGDPGRGCRGWMTWMRSSPAIGVVAVAAAPMCQDSRWSGYSVGRWWSCRHRRRRG
jgi:Family of unknown function (DUF6444)